MPSSRQVRHVGKDETAGEEDANGEDGLDIHLPLQPSRNEPLAHVPALGAQHTHGHLNLVQAIHEMRRGAQYTSADGLCVLGVSVRSMRNWLEGPRTAQPRWKVVL